jgi:hypothetical protein
MPKDIKPVVPVENEEPVEQAPVANLEAPVVEAADPQEVLEEVSSRFDDLISSPIDWSLVSCVVLKNGVDNVHRFVKLSLSDCSLEKAKALVASGLYDVILKED